MSRLRDFLRPSADDPTRRPVSANSFGAGSPHRMTRPSRVIAFPFCGVQRRGMAWRAVLDGAKRRLERLSLFLCASSVRLAFDRNENREKNESGRAFLRDDSPSRPFSPREHRFLGSETFDRYRSATLTKKTFSLFESGNGLNFGRSTIEQWVSLFLR